MSEAAPVVPFVLLGDTRRALLEGTLADRLQKWWNHWSAAGGEKVVVQTGPDADEACRRFLQSTPSLLVGVSIDDTLGMHIAFDGSLLPAMLGLGTSTLDHTSDHDDVRDLQREILNHLVRTCLAMSLHQRIELDDHRNTQAQRLTQAREGRCVFVLATWQRTRLVILLHPHTLDWIASRRPMPSTERLTRRAGAIDDEHVRIEAFLGEAEVSLQELACLKPGHVIVLNQPLSQPGYLAMHDGRRLASVSVGASDVSRAVIVTKS